MGSPPNCIGPTNMDIEEPQFVRIVLLAFKEFPVKGSPFGLSLVVPLWSPPCALWISFWRDPHVKPSPCCRPLYLSGKTCPLVWSRNFPMHISKARGCQFWLISLYRNGWNSFKRSQLRPGPNLGSPKRSFRWAVTVSTTMIPGQPSKLQWAD